MHYHTNSIRVFICSQLVPSVAFTASMLAMHEAVYALRFNSVGARANVQIAVDNVRRSILVQYRVENAVRFLYSNSPGESRPACQHSVIERFSTQTLPCCSRYRKPHNGVRRCLDTRCPPWACRSRSCTRAVSTSHRQRHGERALEI